MRRDGRRVPPPLEVLRALDWQPDRVSLGDFELALETAGTQQRPTSAGDSVVLYKSRAFMGHYEWLLAHYSEFRPQRILELGIWRGGSIALWNEVFHPERLAAIDLLPEPEVPALAEYVERANPTRISLHWNASQDDTTALAEVFARDFDGQAPDLVIDDASHQYGPTRRSFEWIFPRMAHKSLYVIEDWRSSVHRPPGPESIHRIASDLTYTLACGQSPLASVTARGGIIIVERNRRHVDLPFSLATEPAMTASPPSLKSRLRQHLRPTSRQ